MISGRKLPDLRKKVGFRQEKVSEVPDFGPVVDIRQESLAVVPDFKELLRIRQGVLSGRRKFRRQNHAAACSRILPAAAGLRSRVFTGAL